MREQQCRNRQILFHEREIDYTSSIGFLWTCIYEIYTYMFYRLIYIYSTWHKVILCCTLSDFTNLLCILARCTS